MAAACLFCLMFYMRCPELQAKAAASGVYRVMERAGALELAAA
jgi:hypothetical protein